jgi:hypothetical protein
VKRGVRRIIVKLTLCTLAGAVVTWGVAWGCALFSGNGESLAYDQFTDTQRSTTRADRFIYRGKVHWALLCDGSEKKRPGVELPSWVERPALGEVAHSTACGWPLIALYAGYTYEFGGANFRSRGEAVIPAMGGWYFPTLILPLGFTLNTFLTAGVLLGMVEGFAFARRRVRRANGRCAGCGYDRGGLAKDAACPECGAGTLR